jgi:hypothetical protein
MSYTDHRAIIIGHIWQSIAQSGIDLSTVAREQQEYLVNTIADSMLLTMDDMLGNISQANPSPEEPPLPTPSSDSDEEQILWEGRPFLSLVETYIVTTERIRIKTGLLSSSYEDIDLIRIQDIDLTQHLTERLINIGDIIIHSSDASKAEIVLHNVKDPNGVHEITRRAVRNARKREGLTFREEL